jgi:hypothetical protein
MSLAVETILARAEGARRATGDPAGRVAVSPDPEVSEKATRRRFRAQYKLGAHASTTAERLQSRCRSASIRSSNSRRASTVNTCG